MPCVNCGAKVASGGDRHRKGGCSIHGQRGARKHSLFRKGSRVSGAERLVIVYGTRGTPVGNLKKGGSRGKGQARKKVEKK